MTARFINEFTEGSRVHAAFVLRSKEIRTSRTGDAFLAVELADRTGAISGVLFRPARIASEVPAGSVVEVEGVVTRFRGNRRLSLKMMRPARRWSPEELMAASPRPLEEMKGELRELVGSIKTAGLRRLLRHLFGDRRVFDEFCRCPGAQSYHHAYIGGLLEHTLAVAGLCSRLAGMYEGVDRDLLVTAALVHDIGKIDELSCETGIEYSDEGRLLGHVVLGVRRVHEAAVASGLDEGFRRRLEHAVLSHHGELEWGSPKRPSTVEALLLHHVDNLDAKTSGFLQTLAGATLADEAWTDAGNLFRRPLYAPRFVEDERPVPPREDEQHYRLTA